MSSEEKYKPKLTPLDSNRIRDNSASSGTRYSWMDENFVFFRDKLSKEARYMYYSLCMDCDRKGLLSFGRWYHLRDYLRMGDKAIKKALGELTFYDLVEHRETENGGAIFQVLSIPADKIEWIRVNARAEEEKIVRDFYSRLDLKATRKKIEKGIKQVAEMGRDGFSLEEIQFASMWAANNIKDPYSFGIVPEIIGQALQDKGKILDEREKEEQDRLRELERRSRFQREDELNKQISRLRQSLTEEDLKRIEKEALAGLGEEYKKIRIEAARRVLLANKENEIIRREYLE